MSNEWKGGCLVLDVGRGVRNEQEVLELGFSPLEIGFARYSSRRLDFGKVLSDECP